MQPEPQRHPVVVEIDGKTYKGTYWIAGEIMTVSTGGGGKSHQIGSRPPMQLAEQLLTALVKAGKA